MALIDVVKWDGSADELVWKFPNSELSTMTQLIVNESQAAILFKDGKRMDVFAAGRHTLSTNNIPVLNKLPENDPGVLELMKAKAAAARRKIEGTNYAQTSNPGMGGAAANLGAKLAMGQRMGAVAGANGVEGQAQAAACRFG